MSVWPLAFARARRATLLSGLVAILVGFMLSGCSTLRSEAENPPPITAVCHGAQCKVWVVVVCEAPSPCEIKSPITDDNLDMNGFQEVVWEIVSNGQPYTFKVPGGIFFKDAEAQGLIPCHPEGSLGTRFRCHSKTKNGEAYKYSIQLNGTPPLTVDPWIVNR